MSGDNMTNRGHIAILLGGTSAEREVSLVSGKACKEALQSLGYRVTEIDPSDDLGEFIAALKACKPDKVFNALHGCPGEDGLFQAVLDWLGIPYTHSDMTASAVAMDKELARRIFMAHGIPVAEGGAWKPAELQKAYDEGAINMAPPFVIKPLKEGSSVGVHIIHAINELESILANWSHGDILLEEYIGGKELTVSVMGNKALEVTDLIPESGFYDFTAKYTDGKTRHICPAEIDGKLRQQCLDYALQAHKALGCRGVSRADFRYDDKANRLVILEVNTQPGMTPLSLVPEQARYLGISFAELCEWILQCQ